MASDDFLTDEQMRALEEGRSPDFLTDEEMARLEAGQPTETAAPSFLGGSEAAISNPPEESPKFEIKYDLLGQPSVAGPKGVIGTGLKMAGGLATEAVGQAFSPIKGPVAGAAYYTPGEALGEYLGRELGVIPEFDLETGEPAPMGEKYRSLDPRENPIIQNLLLGGAGAGISKAGSGMVKAAGGLEKSALGVTKAMQGKALAREATPVLRGDKVIKFDSPIDEAVNFARKDGLFKGEKDAVQLEAKRLAKEEALSSEVEKAILPVDQNLKGVRVKPDFSIADDYVNSLGSTDKKAATEFLDTLKNDLRENPSNDGSLSFLHNEKKGLYRFVYPENPSTKEQLELEVRRRFAASLSATINKAVPGVRELNEQLGHYLELKPILNTALAASDTQLPFAGVTKFLSSPLTHGAGGAVLARTLGVDPVTGLALGTGLGMGARSLTTPESKLAIAGGFRKIGPGLTNIGEVLSSPSALAAKTLLQDQTVQDLQAQEPEGLPPGPSQRLPALFPQDLRAGPGVPENVDPFANGLPRRTDAFDGMALQRFMMATANRPTAAIAQQLTQKFEEAVRSQDRGKQQRLVADMAKLFPDVFEPGLGVDGKLYHPDDQAEYMELLKSAMRDGRISSIFLAKQQNAFGDKSNSSILPIENGIEEQSQGQISRRKNTPPQDGQPRQYTY